MGNKHNKKRYFCVKYVFKPDKKFDEFVELSKKKIGSGKMLEYTVILDLVNEKIIKTTYLAVSYTHLTLPTICSV